MKKKSAKSKLPNKPSNLILRALKDLRAVEKNPKYRIDMRDWHSTYQYLDGTKVCSVCFAGAVMVQSLNIPSTISVVPSDQGSGLFTKKDIQKLEALDFFREGYNVDAFEEMGLDSIKLPQELRYTDIVNYSEENVDLFKEQLTKLALKFRKLGF